ncbi:hypothetical protein [Vannielia litorea]|uniref:Type IV pilus biogenesis protein PilP n=1 Tax=Vannielia litorea TaxID=1217970 RepID=A0A1N6G725_9RHOB|nr:hypothetical protein [Vannielia litorea]SIO03318.1 hypothetical protein SAMN05444002_2254 [Vannielia litorea]
MTPEFALDLSHDGITLLRRADDGWRRVGAVALDADRLIDDLAALREKAGDRLRSKLVIPNSQILYTSCPASGKDALADEVRVRAALVGATPYDVSELVFDWESDGETLQIAVVARETLEEARAFASEHGFGPVGYVAVPPRGAFLREPFFGPVDRGPGAGQTMLAEAEPIDIVGDWEPADDAPLAAPAQPEADEPALRPGAEAEVNEDRQEASEAETQAAAQDEAPGAAPAPESQAEAPGADAASEIVAEAMPVDGPADAAPEDLTTEVATSPEEEAEAEVIQAENLPSAEDETPGAPDTAQAPEPGAPPANVSSDLADTQAMAPEPAEDDAVEAAAPDETEDQPEAASMPAFSSIRTTAAAGNAPRLGAATDLSAPAPARKLGGAQRKETPPSPATRIAKDRPAETTAPELATAAPAQSTPAPKSAKPAPAAIDPEIAPQSDNPRSTAALSSFRTKVPGLRRAGTKPALTPEIISAPLPRPAPEDLPARVSQEATAGDFTIFGARGKAKTAAKKGFPIGLTLGLLLFLGVLGLWSKLFLASDETATQDSPVLAEQSVASAVPLLGGDGALTRSITFSETGTSGATTEPGGDAALADALQAPTEADPAMSGDAQVASLADDPFSALPEEEARISEPMLENPPLPEIDADAEPADADELADMEPEPEANPAERLTPAEAQAAYAESGIWQQAPEPAALPVEDSTDDIYIASIDPGVTPHDAVALPRAETGGGSDVAPDRQASPMPPGQEFEFDADGSIRPTEEGVVTADGITLYAGRPPVVPRPRAATAPEVAAETEADPEANAEADSTLAGVRPRSRPAGLVEENEKTQLGGRTRAEMAGLRPRQRPQSLQDQAEAARQAAIEAAVVSSEAESADLAEDEQRAAAEAAARAEAELQSASRLAVASSRTPAARPRGFDGKVASARKQAEAEAEAQARAAAAAAARSTASASNDTESDAGEEETATAAVVLPRNQKVAPSVPSSASVAKAATERNALKLRDINLIGVFGSPSQRRALVRLPSGRLIKVKAGDRLDGGKVAVIGEHDLRYVKRGKNITLSMPQG